MKNFRFNYLFIFFENRYFLIIKPINISIRIARIQGQTSLHPIGLIGCFISFNSGLSPKIKDCTLIKISSVLLLSEKIKDGIT